MPKRLRGKFFLSTEQTGNGSLQSIAHGLKRTPIVVKVMTTDSSGTILITEGAHDSTNCKVTVTTGVKYKVYGEI